MKTATTGLFVPQLRKYTTFGIASGDTIYFCQSVRYDSQNCIKFSSKP